MRGFPFLSLFAAVLAQTGPQATQIPPCVKSCDPAAIASVNCSKTDQLCHCQRQKGILSNISVCADQTCQDPSADLYVFTTLFGQVCSPFNITVPVLGSNSSANGTMIIYPSASSQPYTGDANRGREVGLPIYTLVMSGAIGLAVFMWRFG